MLYVSFSSCFTATSFVYIITGIKPRRKYTLDDLFKNMIKIRGFLTVDNEPMTVFLFSFLALTSKCFVSRINVLLLATLLKWV